MYSKNFVYRQRKKDTLETKKIKKKTEIGFFINVLGRNEADVL